MTGPLTRLVPLDDVTMPASDSLASDSLAEFRGAAISIGNFDGVHRGHQALLSRLRRMADSISAAAVAVTFDPHPAAVLRPGDGPTPLAGMETRAARMGDLGVDALVVCRTTPQLLALSAADFYAALVGQRLAAGGMIEGPNFYFGRDRTGNVEILRQWCRRDGRQFALADATDDGGRMVSSSRIRSLVADGNIEAAVAMLGHPHRIGGPVVHGDARGRTIGFPTANLSPVDVVLPGPGVYGGRTRIDDVWYAVAVHIGPNPTFAIDAMKVEVHVIDFEGNLYDRMLAVDVTRWVRDISRFRSADDLAAQLARDIDFVRNHVSVEPDRKS